MKTTHRNYAETTGDFNRLCRFIIANNRHLRATSTWCLGRFVDWKYGLYENKQAVAGFCDTNAQLWFDAFDDLAGFAISEDGDSRFAIVLAAGYRWLFAEMLAWALDNWSGRGSRCTIEVTEQQPIEIGILERAGFRQAASFVRRRFDLTIAPCRRDALEPGFTVVDMATHPDYREQRRLRADAFGGQPAPSDDALDRQLAFYNYIHAGPIYHPACDLCIMAEDGQFVAGCEALIDARNAEADIERVCTHSQFRRRGFARAVIQECLHRLHVMGMQSAYITGYSPEAIALYGSLGAVDARGAFVYERPN